MLPDDYEALIKARYTVRDFRPDPVPDDVVDAILDDARYCPSWSNTRPYVLAVASGERRDRLAAAYLKAFDASLPLQRKDPKAIAKAVLTRGWPDADFKTWGRYPDGLLQRSQKVGRGLYEHVGVARGDRAARDAFARRNCEFFGAPVVLLLFVHDGLLPFSGVDAGLMLQTLMLSATAHGVGTCPLGVLATWRHPSDAEFDIPKHYKLVTGLAMGYASDAPVNAFRADHPPVTLARPTGFAAPR